MLFYGATSGFGQVTPFFFKTALKSAVADAAETFAEIMAGVWPDEQLQEPVLDPRRRGEGHERNEADQRVDRRVGSPTAISTAHRFAAH